MNSTTKVSTECRFYFCNFFLIFPSSFSRRMHQSQTSKSTEISVNKIGDQVVNEQKQKKKNNCMDPSPVGPRDADPGPWGGGGGIMDLCLWVRGICCGQACFYFFSFFSFVLAAGDGTSRPRRITTTTTIKAGPRPAFLQGSFPDSGEMCSLTLDFSDLHETLISDFISLHGALAESDVVEHTNFT